MRINILNSPRLSELKRKRRKVVVSKILFCLFIIGGVLASLAYLFRIERLNIQVVEAKGNKIIDTRLIAEIAEKEMAGNYLWLFPKTNIFFYPKEKIKSSLYENFKRLRNIEIEMGSGAILVVSTEERMPKYTWCGETLPTSRNDSQDCYFLDETGYIFGRAPYFSGEVYFKFYGATDSKENTPIGSYFLADIFQKLILFKEALSHMGLKPVVLYKDKEENEDIKIFLSSANTLPNAPEIIFKADSDLEIIAENLQTALTTEPLQSNFKNKYSSLLYIDLRYGNKVYYKFK